LKDFTEVQDLTMASFDVENLFTNIGTAFWNYWDLSKYFI
jgi:hypothetical protein